MISFNKTKNIQQHEEDKFVKYTVEKSFIFHCLTFYHAYAQCPPVKIAPVNNYILFFVKFGRMYFAYICSTAYECIMVYNDRQHRANLWATIT